MSGMEEVQHKTLAQKLYLGHRPLFLSNGGMRTRQSLHFFEATEFGFEAKEVDGENLD